MADNSALKLLKELKKQNAMASFLSDGCLSRVDGWIKTRSYALNAICSGKLEGGIPRGRMTVVAGESMTLKSYLADEIMMSFLSEDPDNQVIVIDTEHAYDEKNAKKKGIDTDRVLHFPCFTYEETRNHVHKFGELAKADPKLRGKFLIIIDSLTQLESQMMINRQEKDNTSVDMGSVPRAVRSLLKNCIRVGAETGTTFYITAHIYDDPGAMFPSLEKAIPGGKSVRYLPSLVIQLARRTVKEGAEKDTDGKNTANQKLPGAVIRALTVKNRFIKQLIEASMYISFDNGLHPYFGLLEIAEQFNVINKVDPVTKKESRLYFIAETGEKLGNYADWHKNKEIWNKILPLIQREMDAHWQYGSSAGVEEEDPSEVDGDDDKE